MSVESFKGKYDQLEDDYIRFRCAVANAGWWRRLLGVATSELNACIHNLGGSCRAISQELEHSKLETAALVMGKRMLDQCETALKQAAKKYGIRV